MRKILIVDDEEQVRTMLGRMLGSKEYSCQNAANAAEARQYLASESFDLILCDINMPGESGLDLVRFCLSAYPDMAAVMATAVDDLLVAESAFEIGIYDYIIKPLNYHHVLISVANSLHRRDLEKENKAYREDLEKMVSERTEELEKSNQALEKEMAERLKAEQALKDALQMESDRLREENLRLKTHFKKGYKFGEIVGKSKPMQDVYDLILKASATNANVIVYGESGTGKELVARAIHDMNQSRKGSFVPVNCGAIPEHLLESEFFGYKKGAFTGANKDKPGLLDLAHGGTLFLDEVGEIELGMQVKLLRAIEGKGYSPVGGDSVKKPDVRIVAATNRDLADLVMQGKMRDDFYYRIHVIPIHLPPLRKRKEDVTLLVYHFLEEHGKKTDTVHHIPKDVMEAMLAYQWPGNVRELENVIHRYISLDKLDFAGLPFQKAMPENHGQTAIAEEDSLLPLSEASRRFEKKFIMQALEQNSGNRTRTAEALGIERRTLQKKIKSLGLS